MELRGDQRTQGTESINREGLGPRRGVRLSLFSTENPMSREALGPGHTGTAGPPIKAWGQCCKETANVEGSCDHPMALICHLRERSGSFNNLARPRGLDFLIPREAPFIS